ncbi:MAG: hypothetical protein EBU90_15405 [Proteobacteria bacterium]|nr:hypothetical protein [Pseudomonadota bacterium]
MRKKKDRHEDPIYAKGSARNKTGNYKSKSQHSILHRHYQKLDEFNNKTQRLSTLQTKVKNTEKEIERLHKNKSLQQINNASADAIEDEIRNKQQELETIKQEQALIESGNDEIDYLLNSTMMIAKFVEYDEREKQLLQLENATDEQVDELNKIAFEKANLTDDYLTQFDDNYVSTRRMFDVNLSFCVDCQEKFEMEGGFLVCPSCGNCFNTIEQSTELSFKEMQTYDYRPQFTYDKRCHLEDWLRRFGAKEHKTIPQEILDKVILEAQKERIRDLNLLSEDKVKRYLKKLGLNEYYDNIISIINRINGRPPFKLTQEIEDKIKSMFQQIQDPFEKHKPPGRKNFLSYSYTLHKFFQILGLHEFSKYFPLLKSADKLRQQDEIFRKIVAEMAEKDKSINWVFYPSI